MSLEHVFTHHSFVLKSMASPFFYTMCLHLLPHLQRFGWTVLVGTAVVLGVWSRGSEQRGQVSSRHVQLTSHSCWSSGVVIMTWRLFSHLFNVRITDTVVLACCPCHLHLINKCFADYDASCRTCRFVGLFTAALIGISLSWLLA